MKKLLAFTLTLCMVLSLVTVLGLSASAADTAGKTYTMTQVYDDGKYSVALQGKDSVTVSNANELALFALYVNAGKPTKGVTFRLTANISLDDQYIPEFTIGNTESTPFSGNFDGAGCKITNLNYNKNTDAAGLFGYVNGSVIENLSLVNVSVSGKTGVGALVGVALGTVTLRNIAIDSVNGKISGEQNVGGLIGDASNATVHCINCTSSVAISASGNAGGLIGSVKSADFRNCLMAGRIATSGTTGILCAAGTAVAKSCYYYSSAFENTVPPIGATGEVTAWDASKDAAEAARELNAYCLTGETDSAKCFAWTTKNNKAVLAGSLPEVKVTVGDAVSVFATLAEAVKFAANSDKATILQPMRDFTVNESVEIGGNYTFDLRKFTITVKAPLTVSKGTLTITGNSLLTAPESVTILMQDGNRNVASGSIVSKTSFAIKNAGTGILRIYGHPSISGAAEGSVYLSAANTLIAASDAAKPESYTGSTVRVRCGFEPKNGAVIVSGAKEKQFAISNYDTSAYVLKYENGALTFCKIGYWAWAVVAVLLIGAAILLVVTIVKTAGFKKRMKNYVVFPFLPSVFFTTRQIGFLIGAAALIFICLLVNLITGSVQKKKEAAAKAKKEEEEAKAPEETPVEEPKEEETPAEEPKEEETPAEEPKEEETPAEEPKEEETPAEEPKEEETPAEEPAEETKEEPTEETDEEPTEETDEGESQIPIVDGNPTIPTAKGDQIVVAERDAAGNMVYSIYKKSFTARLIQSDKEIQERYETVKNALLSYKKVNSRVSWSYDSFKSGHDQLAKITIRGKTPYLYLALDPASLEGSKYNVTDAGKAKKYSTVPCRLRLTSKRSVKWATELIDVLAEKKGLVKDPKFQPATYVSENETTEALIEKGLIKKAQ